MKTNIQNEIDQASIPSESTSNKIAKRIFDILVSFFILVLISPILLIVAILILISDGRPILFKQERTGLNGNVFRMWKFRTMKIVKDPQGSKKKYDWENGVPDDFVFKTSYNPNITKVGAFLRKYSLDELPQFFNVLFGQMSIVGPRPEIVDITKCYNDYQAQRLLVKPGITGHAQTNGRAEIPHGEKIEYDLYYVRNSTIFMDIKILFLTIYQTIFGKGAY